MDGKKPPRGIKRVRKVFNVQKYQDDAQNTPQNHPAHRDQDKFGQSFFVFLPDGVIILFHGSPPPD